MAVSAYEKVTRNMVDNLCQDFGSFKMEIKQEFADLKATNAKLYNHLSERVPKDIANKMALLTGVLGTVLGGVLIGLILKLV